MARALTNRWYWRLFVGWWNALFLKGHGAFQFVDWAITKKLFNKNLATNVSYSSTNISKIQKYVLNSLWLCCKSIDVKTLQNRTPTFKKTHFRYTIEHLSRVLPPKTKISARQKSFLNMERSTVELELDIEAVFKKIRDYNLWD